MELGVTGLIVRFADSNPVLLGAISRVQGWRPNPSGSHHVPCTLPAITSLLAFAEMYDFERTDGADSWVRQLIRDSYTTREWQKQAETAAAAAATAPAPRIRIVPSQRDAVLRWVRLNPRALVIAPGARPAGTGRYSSGSWRTRTRGSSSHSSLSRG